MLYCLSGLLFYPSVTLQSQGHLCSENSANEYCAGDQNVKKVVSFVAFLTIVLMVLVSIGLTARAVRERGASMRAANNVLRLQGVKRADSFTRLESSTNRVSMTQVLDGQKLLKWTEQLSHQVYSFSYKASSLHFMVGAPLPSPRASLPARDASAVATRPLLFWLWAAL